MLISRVIITDRNWPYLELASVNVNVAILALNSAVGVSGFELERAVGGFVPVGIRPIFVVPGMGNYSYVNDDRLAKGYVRFLLLGN